MCIFRHTLIFNNLPAPLSNSADTLGVADHLLKTLALKYHQQSVLTLSKVSALVCKMSPFLKYYLFV